VRWAVFALILAEEEGVTRADPARLIAAGHTCIARLDSDEGKLMARNLGIFPGGAKRAVRTAGNYGEMFERNLGRGSPLGIERGVEHRTLSPGRGPRAAS